MPNKSPISTRYSELEGVRSSFLTRGEQYSKMTLPYILPQTKSDGAQNKHGYQGIGAEAVNHLANKMVATLFPIAESFFKLGFDSDTQAELEQSDAIVAELDIGLNKIVDLAIIEMNKLKLRPDLISKAKHLIISGNAMLVFTDKGVKLLGLDKYVVKRDTCGNLLRVISKEKVSFLSLPPEMKEVLKVKPNGKLAKNRDDNEELDLYTSYALQEDGTFTIEQAVDEFVAGEAKEGVKPEDLPAIVGRWNSTSGEDYGRGLVEDHSGDLHVLEFLSEARALGSATMMDVKYLVRPGSLTDIESLNKAPTGEFCQGMPEDIAVLQLDKFADGRLIQDVMQEYQQRISRAFLMLQSQIRDSERTTAFEIQKTANEMDLSLGGVYSTQVVDWQLPVANQLLSKVNTKLVDAEFEPQIKSGLAALGRASELEKLGQFSEMMALPQAWPEELRRNTDWDLYSNLVASNISLDISFIKKADPEQETKEQESVEESALGESLAKSAGSSLGKQLIEGER